MKERPILFSAAMVRALLSGTKTQTRRVAKLNASGRVALGGKNWHCGDPNAALACPYGQPGELLWVRETWSTDFAQHYPHDPIWYAADDDRHHDIEVRDGVRGIFSPESQKQVPFRWHPSIHMFRWASRITLEIVSVRLERLQEISEADALAEGIDPGTVQSFARVEGVTRPAGFAYRDLWESINGPDSWGENPFVWVVEFKRVAKKGGAL